MVILEKPLIRHGNALKHFLELLSFVLLMHFYAGFFVVHVSFICDSNAGRVGTAASTTRKRENN